MKTLNKKYILQGGFTLVEVMIALSVLAFIMMAVITVTESSLTISERVISEDKESLSLETALSRLEWDFSHIYSPLYFSHVMKPNALGEVRAEAYNQLLNYYQSNDRFSMVSYDSLPIPNIQLQDKTTLTFFTSSHRRKRKDIKQSNFAWVQYSLGSESEYPSLKSSEAEEKEIKGSVLLRRVISQNVFSSDRIDWDDNKAQVLFRKVIKLGYEFWNPETKKWVENIDLIKDGKYLIRGLRMTLKYYDPDDVERTILRVYRPLFPYFKPEDMYKFLKGEIKNPTTPSEESGDLE